MFQRLSRANREALQVLNPEGYAAYVAYRRQVAERYRLARAIARARGPVALTVFPTVLAVEPSRALDGFDLTADHEDAELIL